MRVNLLIVGPGRAGLSLGYALHQAEGVGSLVYCGRHPEPPAHPLFTQQLARYVHGLEPPDEATTAIVIAVPDDAVIEVARDMAALAPAPSGCVAFHLCGALSTEALAPLHARGYRVGSFHPLQTLAHPVTGADLLPGSTVSLAGEREALVVARQMATSLGCPTLQIPANRRALSHAAAVESSNYIVALMAHAVHLLERAGVPHDEARDALLPLARGTLDNIEQLGIAGALTGPVARGDADTLCLHLRSLEGRDRELYGVLAGVVVDLARSRSLSEEAADRLLRVLRREVGAAGTQADEP